MKRILAIVLVICMMSSLTACGNAADSPAAATAAIQTEAESLVPTETVKETEEAALIETTEAEKETSEEDTIEDEGWDSLAALGGVKTENGLLTVTMTVPAEFVGSEATQESLNESVPEKCLAVTLNDDGSATYVLTKRQHKVMMDATAESMDQAIQAMAEDAEYQFREIKHNGDFTHFDVYLETEELGFNETFAVLALYLYGGMYGVFSGSTPEHITASIYDVNDTLIDTYDSADMEE